MRSKIFKPVFFGAILSLTMIACGSEEKMERSHEEDHEVFGAAKTKNDSSLNKNNTADSIPIHIPDPDSIKNPK